MLKKMIMISVVLAIVFLTGCQNDTEIVFRNSARILRKTESAESRMANPYAGSWSWGNQSGMQRN